MASVTVTGSPEQIATVLRRPLSTSPKAIARRRNKERQDRIIANRKIIRAAFDLIRYDPNEHLLVSNFAGALGGRLELTGSLLDAARQIIAERS